jgi:hypothetical protein
MVARTVCSSMGFTGVYSAAEVVIGVIEARDDAEVVIGLVMGVDRHFCELLVVCRIEVFRVAYCASRCERILP